MRFKPHSHKNFLLLTPFNAQTHVSPYLLFLYLQLNQDIEHTAGEKRLTSWKRNVKQKHNPSMITNAERENKY